MDKKIAGLLGAVSVLVLANGAQAKTAETSTFEGARSFADLLKPIPNAVALLSARDASAVSEAKSDLNGDVRVAYHHHHHHNRRHHHHHHHHHHMG